MQSTRKADEGDVRHAGSDLFVGNEARFRKEVNSTELGLFRL